MLNISVLTHIPEFYPGVLQASLIGKALGTHWSLKTYNIKDYGLKQHKQVDDEPYGGGAGMVIRPDVLGKAITDISAKDNIKHIYYPSPRGNLLTQNIIADSLPRENILFISGRFEGIDQRIISKFNITEFSIGDFILCGGDVAIMAFIEAAIRIIPGVVGKTESLQEESFASNSEYEHLLEYPQYTRPSKWEGLAVPETLLSGNHEKIRSFRLTKAKELTRSVRPDLFRKYLDKLLGN